MPRWWIFAPLGGFVGLIALVALLYGKDIAALSESEVINRYAERYVVESGNPNAQITDCLAVPGQGQVWLTVRCAGYDYDVNRFGGLVERRSLSDLPPQT